MNFNQIKNIYNACDKAPFGVAILGFYQIFFFCKKKITKSEWTE